MTEVIDRSYYQKCFGCGPDNPIGAHLKFKKTSEDTVECYFTPPETWVGWGNIVHGGLQALLLDEAAGWGAILLAGAYAVTIKAEIRYLKPLHINQQIRIKATLEKRNGDYLTFHAELHNQEGTVCTQGQIVYKIVPKSFFIKIIESRR